MSDGPRHIWPSGLDIDRRPIRTRVSGDECSEPKVGRQVPVELWPPFSGGHQTLDCCNSRWDKGPAFAACEVGCPPHNDLEAAALHSPALAREEGTASAAADSPPGPNEVPGHWAHRSWVDRERGAEDGRREASELVLPLVNYWDERTDREVVEGAPDLAEARDSCEVVWEGAPGWSGGGVRHWALHTVDRAARIAHTCHATGEDREGRLEGEALAAVPAEAGDVTDDDEEEGALRTPGVSWVSRPWP
jgi:hypothetical protein